MPLHREFRSPAPLSARPHIPSAPTLERPLARGFAPWLGATLLRCLGWTVVLAQPVPARCVVIFFPHTSNWDTAIGLCVKFMTGLPIRFAGKDTLFKVPLLGRLLLRWGGVPVNRRERTGFIEEMTARFRRSEELRLAIAPEGTRGRAPYWKSGFYHLARAADVPLALGFIDYPRREVGLGGYLDLTGNVPADMARLRAFYAAKRGRHPQNQGPVRLRDEPPAVD
jgi:1-acyl-sn-glycerol-3-phosphate acyltransferase